MPVVLAMLAVIRASKAMNASRFCCRVFSTNRVSIALSVDALVLLVPEMYIVPIEFVVPSLPVKLLELVVQLEPQYV